MRLMENRYHKVVGLGPVLNWSRKNVVGLGRSKLIHIGKKKKKKRKRKKKNNKKKTVVFITEIKKSRIPCKSASSFNIFDKHGPTLEGSREQSSFLWFSQKLRIKYRTYMVVDKNTHHLRTRTRGLTDLLTIHGLHNKIRTNYSRIS